MKKKYCFIIYFVVAGFTCFSQTEIPASLTFQDAIQIGLANNLALNQQTNFIEQNKVQRTSAIAQLGPQVAINGTVGRTDGNSFNNNEGKVVNGVIDGVGGQLAVTMPLFNGLSGMNLARSADRQLDAQLYAVQRSKQDIINTISGQFLRVLLDKQLLVIAQENLEVQVSQYDQVKAQVDLGSRTPVDKYSQLGQKNRAELLVLQQEVALRNDLILLSNTLGIDPTTDFDLVEPTWDINGVSLDGLDLNTLLEMAIDQRSDLRQQRLLQESSKYRMSASKGNFYPSINAFYTYGSQFNNVHGTPDSVYRDFNQQFFQDNLVHRFGLNFTIPIFRAFQNKSTYVQAKVNFNNSKLTTRQREIVVKGEVIGAYKNFQSIQEAYQVSTSLYEAAELAFKLEKERFDLGITNFVDFANANANFVQAQSDLAQAKFRLLFQRILLDYAVGTLKIEDLP